MSDEATVRVQPKVPARTSIFIDASAYSALVERGTIDDVRSALGKRRIDALFTYDLALDLCERDEAEPGLLAEAAAFRKELPVLSPFGQQLTSCLDAYAQDDAAVGWRPCIRGHDAAIQILRCAPSFQAVQNTAIRARFSEQEARWAALLPLLAAAEPEGEPDEEFSAELLATHLPDRWLTEHPVVEIAAGTADNVDWDRFLAQFPNLALPFMAFRTWALCRYDATASADDRPGYLDLVYASHGRIVEHFVTGRPILFDAMMELTELGIYEPGVVKTPAELERWLGQRPHLHVCHDDD